MAHKHLSYYLDNLSRLEEITVEELQDWQNEYPYVQNLKFLIAKKQQQISNNPDKDSLQIASVYSADRSFLYKQLAPETEEAVSTKNTESAKVPTAAAITGVAAIATGATVIDKKKKKAKKQKIEDRNENVAKEKTKDKTVAKVKSKAIASEAKRKAKKEKSEAKIDAKSKSSSNKAPSKKAVVKKKPLNLKYHNLKKIEGIGPKIEKLLYAANIRTYKQLAASSENRLTKAILKGGARYKSHNPSTWPKQARLAASGKWDQLKKLQDKIEGGKIKTTKKTDSIKKTAKAKALTTKKSNKPTIKRVKKITVAPAAKKKVKKKTTVAKGASKTKTTPKKKTALKAKTKIASKTKSNAKKVTSSGSAKAKKTVAKKEVSKKPPAKKTTTKKASPSSPASKAKTKSASTKKVKAKKKSGRTKKAIANPVVKNSITAKSKKSSSKSKSALKNKEEDVSSFSQWLMSLRSEEKKQKKTAATKAKKPARTSGKTDKKIKASIKNKDKVVSESLAKLLAKQGHHTKARNMYKKLSLLFPQKSAYFAAQIDKLKSNK